MKIKVPTTIEREYPNPAYFKSETGKKFLKVREVDGELVCDTIYLSDSYCSYSSNSSMSPQDIVNATEIEDVEYKRAWREIGERMVKDLDR